MQSEIEISFVVNAMYKDILSRIVDLFLGVENL